MSINRISFAAGLLLVGGNAISIEKEEYSLSEMKTRGLGLPVFKKETEPAPGSHIKEDESEERPGNVDFYGDDYEDDESEDSFGSSEEELFGFGG